MEKVLSWVNGVAADTVSVQNRGLAYGDGVFETVLCHGACPEHWDKHLQRLQRGCECLNLAYPNLSSVVAMAMAAVSSPYSVLKIIVTRSEAAAAYAYESSASDTIVILKPYTPKPITNLRVGTASIAIAQNPQLAGIKHLSRLEHVLAAAEAKREGVDDLLLLDTHANVIETIHSNVFFLQAGRWYTPSLSKAGVAGIMRQYLLEEYFPEQGIDCAVTEIKATALVNFEAAFISNSLRGIRPISVLNGRNLNTDTVIRQIKINA